jgi:hypothetical protein
MGDTFARTGTADAARDGNTTIGPDPTPSSTPQYVSLRPHEFTPPASPQPQALYVARRGFGSGRSRHPVQLHMDSAAAAAYDLHAHGPSPADSPTLPPMGLPSPQFSSRQRAPSLLRHAAVPSPYPLNNESPRVDYATVSTVVAPTMIRQGSGLGSPDLRAIYNPLASNPVHHNGPAWDSSSEDVSSGIVPKRARGLTSSSQPVFLPTPPLRSVTSIPDYGQFRGNDRANLSGTYKPNRGVPNWSHTDYYPPPPRQFRGEEPRASFRSAWTNGSSSLMEASGTERSSVVTARSSVVSDRQTSIYSRDQSTDRLRDRDDSPETVQTSEAPEEDDNRDAVDDFIDAYCYDEDGDEQSQGIYHRNSRRYSSSPAPLDPELPELSQTPSREVDSLSSLQSADHLKPWDGRPSSYLQDSSDNNIEKTAPSRRLSVTHHSPRIEHQDLEKPLEDDQLDTEAPDSKETRTSHVSHLQHVHSQAQYVSHNIQAVAQQPNHQQSSQPQRSSEELPRRVSIPLQALALGAPTSMRRPNYAAINGQISKGLNINRTQMTNIQIDISKLPQLPMSKSRLSRQDWAEIEAYSKRHSKRPSASRTLSNDSIKVDPAGMQSPPLKISDPLPALDEDETIPRRASTSVFDRKSALFNLGTIASMAAPVGKPATTQEAAQSPNKDAMINHLRKAVAPAERDRYGFKKASDKINVQQYNAWVVRYEDHIVRRRNKWITLMSKQGLSTSNPTSFPEMCEKVKRYARKGFPPEWRGAMWWYYSGGQHMITQKDMVGLYASLVARVDREELNKDDKDAIERDLDRTFPDNIHFRAEPSTDLLDGDCDDEPQMIKDLREVLSCFALNNPNIGYCQSLNFIAGLLLLFLKQDKERAFVMLTIITQNHLPGAHARNLANTEVNVLMMLIKDYLPKVWVSINDTDLINSGAGSNAHPDSKFQRQPTVALSCTSWFMSIFVGVLPIETVLRVWDCFLYEGPRALYRYALAIFKLGEPEIRKFRPIDPELFMVVQNLPRTCLDPNVLHDLAFVKKGFGNLTQGVIDQKRLFWREQNMMAHQTSVKSQRNKQATPPPKDDETDTDNPRRVLGLRRRASRRFRIGTRRDKT